MAQAQMVGTLKLRSDKIPFLAIPTGASGQYTYKRMQGFTGFSTSKNPSEYSRQYVDEAFEQTDVVGYSPSISFGFDRYVGNEVHDFLAEIIDNEVIGTAAVVQVVVIDLSVTEPSANNAFVRPWAVIADTEGDSMDAYTYSGTFAVKGNPVWGRAEIAADGLTLTFTPTV
ncbi:MAG: hypothetical protein FWE08_03840 [Oscillospiraceae bacterium]|nr:hypothetical protein [Oscillospiraceae bacterium]